MKCGQGVDLDRSRSPDLMRHPFVIGLARFFLLLLWGVHDAYSESTTAVDVTQLSIEELMQREVTSASRTSQAFSDTANAVFVISADDIHRSGATSIPDVLRMAPGVNVARIDANKWAVTIRGFNGRFANKLLVLIDGRTIYTPTFSGVFWETQDLLLEDIDRIEVIRGPGASLWGSNAVNGIINIITKRASDTQGRLLSLTAGDEERAIVGLRYGATLGDQGFFRIYSKYLKRDGLVDANGDDAGDDWEMGHVGFRADWTFSPKNAVTVTGDLYGGSLDQNYIAPDASLGNSRPVQDNVQTSGTSLLARWDHTRSLSSRLTLQVFFQHDERDELLIDEKRDTVDIDFQHELALSQAQEVIWGLGYRFSHDEIMETDLLTASPEEQHLNLASGFLQDRLNLFEDTVEITLGTKVEHNDFTGWELQPSLRGLWKFHPKQRLWGAVSRAVRIPSRADRHSELRVVTEPLAAFRDSGPPEFRELLDSVPPDRLPEVLATPVVATVNGNPDFDSETLISYELGYRAWPSDNLSVDMTVFYHDYDDGRLLLLKNRDLVLGTEQIIVPLSLVNGFEEQDHGVELALDWQALSWWRLKVAYSYLKADVDIKRKFENTAKFFVLPLGQGRSPRNQASLRSSLTLPANLELDLWVRYVDKLALIQTATAMTTGSVDDYVTADIRLAWRPVQDLELSIVGANLLDSPHLEDLQETFTFPTQVERSWYGQLRWHF